MKKGKDDIKDGCVASERLSKIQHSRKCSLQIMAVVRVLSWLDAKFTLLNIYLSNFLLDILSVRIRIFFFSDEFYN